MLLLLFVNKVAYFKEGEQIPFWYSLLIIMSMFIMLMGLMWIVLQVKKNRADVVMDETKPEEVKVFRVTRDGIMLTQFAPKGTFGNIETLAYGEDVDFEDLGEFPLRTLDGSPAVLVFDMLNVVIDPRRSVSRRYMKKHVSSGKEGYNIWKQKKIKEKVA